MDINKIYNNLIQEITKSKVLLSEPMSKHTSFKIGGNADIFIKANTFEDVKFTLEYAKNNNIPLYVIGNGTNLLIKDNGIRGIVLKIDMQDVIVGVDATSTRADVGIRPYKTMNTHT